MYLLRTGSPIIPYSTETKETGTSRLTSIEVEIEDEEILDVIILDDKRYLKLSLGDNPSKYDSYLVNEEDLIQHP